MFKFGFKWKCKRCSIQLTTNAKRRVLTTLTFFAIVSVLTFYIVTDRQDFKFISAIIPFILFLFAYLLYSFDTFNCKNEKKQQVITCDKQGFGAL